MIIKIMLLLFICLWTLFEARVVKGLIGKNSFGNVGYFAPRVERLQEWRSVLFWHMAF